MNTSQRHGRGHRLVCLGTQRDRARTHLTLGNRKVFPVLGGAPSEVKILPDVFVVVGFVTRFEVWHARACELCEWALAGPDLAARAESRMYYVRYTRDIQF